MDVKTITDGSGRTVVTLRDDRGVPYRFVSNAIPVKGQQNPVEVLSIPLSKDDSVTPPRPSLVRGQIFLNGQISFDATALAYVLIDVTVVGYVGSTATVIKRAQLGADPDASLIRVTFGEEDTFDKIGVQAFCVVNGTPSASTNFIAQADISAVAYMWS